MWSGIVKFNHSEEAFQVALLQSLMINEPDPPWYFVMEEVRQTYVEVLYPI